MCVRAHTHTQTQKTNRKKTESQKSQKERSYPYVLGSNIAAGISNTLNEFLI